MPKLYSSFSHFGLHTFVETRTWTRNARVCLDALLDR